MTKHTESRETRASNIRVRGAFQELIERGYPAQHADEIAFRFNHIFGAQMHATTTPTERDEIRARANKGRKELGWSER